jgi:integrase
MRDAMNAAGLPLDCKPHGLRKTLGRRLADAGVSAHDIMAPLGHTTLAQAELYTKRPIDGEADSVLSGSSMIIRRT